MSSTNQEYMDFAQSLAREAGEIMRKYFQKKPESEFKDDNTIVTVADKEINQLVIDRVNETYDGHSIDAEEGSDLKEGATHVWVCDPIDGTRSFSMGIATSVFSLALVVEGELQVAVVFEPYTDMMHSAIKGGGARANGEQLQVSKRPLGADMYLTVASWKEAEYDLRKPIHKLADEQEFRMLNVGSVAHNAMLVARGEIEVTIFAGTKGKQVDMAAAVLIVQEAGGVATDIYGNDQRYDQDINGCIVSNGVVHDDIVAVLRDVKKRGES